MIIRDKKNNLSIEIKLIKPKKTKNYPMVIFCHGWLGNSFKSKRVKITAERLVEKGCGVVLFNMPGHGKSSGDIASITLSHCKKALEFVIDWIVLNKTINRNKIIIIGSSIGGTVSLLTASSDSCIDKLVLLSPRSDFKDTNNSTYEFYKNKKLLINKAIRRSGLHINFYNQAKKISIPTLILHGTEDKDIYYKQSEKLYKNIRSKNKKIILLNGAGHIFKDAFLFKSIDSTVDWVLRDFI
jgi:esterase/lipase